MQRTRRSWREVPEMGEGGSKCGWRGGSSLGALLAADHAEGLGALFSGDPVQVARGHSRAAFFASSR